jgi:hypothetical protein
MGSLCLWLCFMLPILAVSAPSLTLRWRRGAYSGSVNSSLKSSQSVPLQGRYILRSGAVTLTYFLSQRPARRDDPKIKLRVTKAKLDISTTI